MRPIVLVVDDEENAKTFLSAALHEFGGFLGWTITAKLYSLESYANETLPVL